MCASPAVASTPTPRVPATNNAATTPVNVSRLAHLLATHPDKAFASYVVSGMRNGFRIGYSAPAATPIHPSA